MGLPRSVNAQSFVLDFKFDTNGGANPTTFGSSTVNLIPGSAGQTYTVDIWATIYNGTPANSSPQAAANFGLQSFAMRGSDDGGNAFATGAGIGVVSGSFAELAPFNPPSFAQPSVSDIGHTTDGGATTTAGADGILDFGGTTSAKKLTFMSNTGGPQYGVGPDVSSYSWEVGTFQFTIGAASSFGSTTLFFPTLLTAGQGAATAANYTTNGGSTMGGRTTLSSSPLTFVVGPDTWTGAISTNWADNGNWTRSVPGATVGTTNLNTAHFNQNAPNSPQTIDVGRNIFGITFDTPSVNSLTIGTAGGNPLLLTAGGTIQTTPSVVNAQQVNAPLVLEGDYTFTSSASNSSAALSFGDRITPGATSGITTLTLNGGNIGANTISGVLADNGSGRSAVTMSGAGVWILSGNNTFTGGLTINSGIASLGSAGALNSSAPNAVAFGSGSTGTLALGGNSVTVSGLTTSTSPGDAIVENAGGAAAALTVNNAGSNAFGGVMQDGGSSPLSLIKTGGGTLTLTGFNTLTGGMTVSGGIVNLDSPGGFAIVPVCPVVVGSGAELDLNQTDGIHDSPMTVNGLVNITGGGHQHFNLLSLSGGTVETSGSSFANDGKGNYTLDSASTNVGGIAHSTLAASIGIQLNASPTFIVASTGDPAGDLVITANLRDAENGMPAGLTKAGPGNMVLTGHSTYTGSTAISGGTLTTTATGSIGSGPLKVSAADTVTSKLNLGANQTVSSLSGTLAGDGSASVNVASGVTLTVDQATDTKYAGAFALAAGVAAGRGGALIKSRGGTLETQSGSTFANNCFLEVSEGKLRFNVASGSASAGTGAVALVSNGAILELAGSVSALSSGKNGVDIFNDSSAAAGLLVSGTHQQVGAIDGSGNTVVNTGSDLTANGIIQSALVIGGTADNSASVTIAASVGPGGGNPAVDTSADLLSELSSLPPNGPFVAGGINSADLSNGGDTDLAALSPDSFVGGDNPSPVPEPSSLILLAVGAAAFAGLRVMRRAVEAKMNSENNLALNVGKRTNLDLSQTGGDHA